jgi:hypothetical protein
VLRGVAVLHGMPSIERESTHRRAAWPTPLKRVLRITARESACSVERATAGGTARESACSVGRATAGGALSS